MAKISSDFKTTSVRDTLTLCGQTCVSITSHWQGLRLRSTPLAIGNASLLFEICAFYTYYFSNGTGALLIPEYDRILDLTFHLSVFLVHSFIYLCSESNKSPLKALVLSTCIRWFSSLLLLPCAQSLPGPKQMDNWSYIKRICLIRGPLLVYVHNFWSLDIVFTRFSGQKIFGVDFSDNFAM